MARSSAIVTFRLYALPRTRRGGGRRVPSPAPRRCSRRRRATQRRVQLREAEHLRRLRLPQSRAIGGAGARDSACSGPRASAYRRAGVRAGHRRVVGELGDEAHQRVGRNASALAASCTRTKSPAAHAAASASRRCGPSSRASSPPQRAPSSLHACARIARTRRRRARGRDDLRGPQRRARAGRSACASSGPAARRRRIAWRVRPPSARPRRQRGDQVAAGAGSRRGARRQRRQRGANARRARRPARCVARSTHTWTKRPSAAGRVAACAEQADLVGDRRACRGARPRRPGVDRPRETTAARGSGSASRRRARSPARARCRGPPARIRCSLTTVSKYE